MLRGRSGAFGRSGLCAAAVILPKDLNELLNDFQTVDRTSAVCSSWSDRKGSFGMGRSGDTRRGLMRINILECFISGYARAVDYWN